MAHRQLKDHIPARWSSFEEYEAWVRPTYADHQGPWRLTQTNSLFENLFSANEHFQKLSDASMKLSRALTDYRADQELKPDSLDALKGEIRTVTCEGEYLLLHDPFLATNPETEDFIAEKDLDDHWDRYAAEGNGRKLFYVLRQFVDATKKLIIAFYNLREEAHNFLRKELRDVPEELLIDFKISRDLFSVHMEEAGAFFAGRGLERVLRTIARNLRIEVHVKGKPTPLYEMDFADIGEALRRVRWKKTGNMVIDRELKSLIDLLRTARNAVGHPKQNRQKSSLKRNWREIALISASAAAEVWQESSGGRRTLVSTVLQRDW